MPYRLSLSALAAVLLLVARAQAQDDASSPPQTVITIHVSSSTGVDGQDGRTPETAVKTIRRGQALLRNGQPDRLLLKRGDTFEEAFGNWNKSGLSPDDPLVIGAYGEGPRPKVVARETIFNLYGNQPLLHDVVISSIHFAAAGRDPDGVDYDPAGKGCDAIRVVRPVHRLTVEDCRFEFFTGNLVLTGEARAPLQEITVRRCLVLNAYSTAGAFSGQGLYANKVDGLTVEGCVFDHNGWNEKVPGALRNIYRHNLYISHDTSGVKIVGNIIANGASHGLQLRSGGVCEGNLFVDNSIHALMAGDDAVFRGNVLVGGKDIDAKTPRGIGVMMAAGKSVVADNLFLHKPDTAGGAIIVQTGKWSPKTGVGAEVYGNVVYDWAGNGLEVTAPLTSLVFRDNVVQGVAAGRKVVTVKKPAGSMSFSGNRYDGREADRGKWFNTPEGFVSPEQWMTQTGDNSQLAAVQFPAPDRTLPDDFVANARAEKEGYTAAAAIARLREAFGLRPTVGAAR
jgi:hypothetical protein